MGRDRQTDRQTETDRQIQLPCITVTTLVVDVKHRIYYNLKRFPQAGSCVPPKKSDSHSSSYLRWRETCEMCPGLGSHYRLPWLTRLSRESVV